jgi:hypothetical protein
VKIGRKLQIPPVRRLSHIDLHRFSLGDRPGPARQGGRGLRPGPLDLARIEGGRLTVSSIYDWFQADFGGSEQGVIEHLARYADSPLVEKLNGAGGIESYTYDWSLNQP